LCAATAATESAVVAAALRQYLDGTSDTTSSCDGRIG
jgi:hypothetical protein